MIHVRMTPSSRRRGAFDELLRLFNVVMVR